MRVLRESAIQIHLLHAFLGISDLESDDIKIAEVLVTPRSDLIGQTLKESNFRARYGLTTLAIYRKGESIREKIGRVRLRMGDLLLVQGAADRFNDLRRFGPGDRLELS